MANITHKRGDTLEWVVTLTQNSVAVDITDWTIRSQIRQDTTLVYEFLVTKTDPGNGVFSLSATPAETASWPLGSLLIDIEFIDPTGFVISSQTFTMQIVRDITYVE
jgi:hypothetical protein